MKYILLQNQNIVPGTRWIAAVDPSEEQPSMVAKCREFDTELGAREFAQVHTGQFIPGKNWVLIFSGVLEDTKYKVTGSYKEDIESFLAGAAHWLLNH